MSEPVKAAFAPHVLLLSLSNILPMKRISQSIKETPRYQRILASIAEVDIVEPLVLAPRRDDDAPYLLVDGNLRYAALSDLNRSHAPCLVADDDEAFTYNK